MTHPNREELAGRLEDIVTCGCVEDERPIREAAAALRQSPSVEEVARVIHAQVASTDADEMIHHPWQKSWEEPTQPRWTQWEEAAQAIDRLYRGSKE